jgi:diaminopimelate decarboxylase
MLSYQGNLLHFEGRSVKTLASEIDTPVFIASENQLLSNFRTIYDSFKDCDVQPLIRYCAKTNNEAFVIRALAASESHVMVTHDAEAALALECGFPPDKIAYQRPVFIEHEVRAVLKKGVPLIHLYRYQDLLKIVSLANELQIRVKISLRLRSSAWLNCIHPINFPATRLGMDQDELVQAAKLVDVEENLALQGINFYAGTQKGAPGSFRSMLRNVINLTGILKSLGIHLQEINIGGGIPSSSLIRMGMKTFFQGRQEMTPLPDPRSELMAFSTQLAKLYTSEWERAGHGPLPVLALEPGRSLVGNTSILIAQVKAIQGNWVFLDASSNYLGESPLLLWRRILPVEIRQTMRKQTYHFSGSSLNTLDVLGYYRRLPRLEEGDYLVFGDAGAYSISRASRYAGLSPAIYALGRDGKLALVRRSEGFADLTAAMVATK